jgi:hypothetical protein
MNDERIGLRIFILKGNRGVGRKPELSAADPEFWDESIPKYVPPPPPGHVKKGIPLSRKDLTISGENFVGFLQTVRRKRSWFGREGMAG